MISVLLLFLSIVNGYTNPRQLIIDNYKLVHHIINKRFYKLPISVREELKQEAFLGLVKCAERYDPNKNYKFTTYASYYINGYALNTIRKHKNYNSRFELNDFNDENYINYKSFVKNKNSNTYENIDNIDIVNKFYEECEDKDVLYDYFHYKLKQQDIAGKYNMTKKQVAYRIKKNVHNFKINNEIS